MGQLVIIMDGVLQLAVMVKDLLSALCVILLHTTTRDLCMYIHIIIHNGIKLLLTAPDAGESDHFGVSVSLSSDGNTLIVGSYQSGIPSDPNNYYGAAYIYHYNWF